MTKSTERCERALLFTTLSFVYVCPLLCYIGKLQAAAVKVMVPVFLVSAALSVVYALLCLCFRGFVDAAPETNILSCSNLKGCSICMRFKPERTHHCSRCRRCIKKMDHHCHWLGRCINYDNLGHFARFLLFTCISNAILLAINTCYILDAILVTKHPVRPLCAAVAVVSTMIAVLLTVVTGLHCFSQFRMIANNTTYIEVVQRGGFKYAREVYKSVYDMGLYHNLVDVFGPPYFLFLGMPAGDGINFRRKLEPETAYDDDIDSDLFEQI